MKKVYLNTLTPEEVIKRLKAGEVIHIDGRDNDSFKMIDGILCRCFNNKAYILDAGLNIENNDYYFEYEEPFEITETGLYKTRNGRKVFISEVDNTAFGVIEGENSIQVWDLLGQWLLGIQHINDIVAKWED